MEIRFPGRMFRDAYAVGRKLFESSVERPVGIFRWGEFGKRIQVCVGRDSSWVAYDVLLPEWSDTPVAPWMQQGGVMFDIDELWTWLSRKGKRRFIILQVAENGEVTARVDGKDDVLHLGLWGEICPGPKGVCGRELRLDANRLRRSLDVCVPVASFRESPWPVRLYCRRGEAALSATDSISGVIAPCGGPAPEDLNVWLSCAALAAVREALGYQQYVNFQLRVVVGESGTVWHGGFWQVGHGGALGPRADMSPWDAPVEYGVRVYTKSLAEVCDRFVGMAGDIAPVVPIRLSVEQGEMWAVYEIAGKCLARWKVSSVRLTDGWSVPVDADALRRLLSLVVADQVDLAKIEPTSERRIVPSLLIQGVDESIKFTLACIDWGMWERFGAKRIR